MSVFYMDPDAYEPVWQSGPDWACMSYRPRSPEDYARVRAERIRREEDEILRRAIEIIQKRMAQP